MAGKPEGPRGWWLIIVGLLIMLFAVAFNFSGLTGNLFLKLGGLLVFFLGGFAAALGLCSITPDPDLWAKPASLVLTLLGVMLLAAVQFDDEMKAALTSQIQALHGDIAEAETNVAHYRTAFGTDPAKFQEINEILGQGAVRSAYDLMHYYCSADASELSKQHEIQPRLDVTQDSPFKVDRDPTDQINKMMEAAAKAGIQIDRGCNGLKIVAGWFAAETRSLDPKLLEAVSNGTATEADFVALFRAAPRVYRQTLKDQGKTPQPSELMPEIGPTFSDVEDDLTLKRKAEKHLSERQTTRKETQQRLDEVTGPGSRGVNMAKNINIAFWTFMLVLAVCVDAATWFHHRWPPKPSGSG